MKKKVVLSLPIIVLIISSVLYIFSSDNNNEIVNSKKEVVNNSFLTLMLEQSDGTYQESTSNTWPGEGYIFNSELSSCQNGGELDYDSENNKVILYSNKSDGCYVYFDLYTKPQINSINLGEVTNNSITITVSATNGTNQISNYYYIINDGVPISTTSNTYTFSGLDSGTTYTIKVYVEDTEGYSSEVSSLNVETDDIVLLADWVVSQYNGTQGNNGVHYHTSSLAYSAGDNSYRYSGANPNNYVCFGSDAVTCPSDNLYRIIGVFDSEVKLIKADYANSNLLGTDGTYTSRTFSASDNENYTGNHTTINRYYWGNSSTTSWVNSLLNTLNLNSNYLNQFENKWKNMISNHSWKVGGVYWERGSSNYTSKTIYDSELGNSNVQTHDAKIGLMYASDYGYAASPDAWTTNLNLYNNSVIISTNWLYLGVQEWTITFNSADANTSDKRAFIIFDSGELAGNGNIGDLSGAVRPTFYLASS